MGLFWYQSPSFLAKDLLKTKHGKNDQLVNNINDSLIDLRKAIMKKEIPQNENPKKIIDIFEKILPSNDQQNVKNLKYQLLNKCFKDYQKHLHK